MDGAAVPVRAGQTVAAVLLDLDRVSWRTTASGRSRGLFCGIGVCFDCVLTVNGVRDVRACLRLAEPGDMIETDQPG